MVKMEIQWWKWRYDGEHGDYDGENGDGLLCAKHESMHDSKIDAIRHNGRRVDEVTTRIMRVYTVAVMGRAPEFWRVSGLTHFSYAEMQEYMQLMYTCNLIISNYKKNLHVKYLQNIT